MTGQRFVVGTCSKPYRSDSSGRDKGQGAQDTNPTRHNTDLLLGWGGGRRLARDLWVLFVRTSSKPYRNERLSGRDKEQGPGEYRHLSDANIGRADHY